MFDQTMLNTEAALLRVKNFYESHYEQVLKEYNATLCFETLLEYFTGSCSLVVEMRSMSEDKGKVEMIYMVDCHKTDFTNDDEKFAAFFDRQIYKPYFPYFKLNYLISDFRLSKKVFIKNSVAMDSIISVRMTTDLINLDINGHKLSGNLEYAKDLGGLLRCISLGLADL